VIAQPAAPRWLLHPRHDPALGRDVARGLSAPEAIGNVLVHRGLRDLASARSFLEPTLADLHDPRSMRDLDRAATRLRAAGANGERVLVQGDYDVDGVTSAYLMASVLARLGARVHVRIPHRTRDGYGLTDAAVDEARRRACTLIVTVDCGVTAVGPIAKATALGIDAVVTDHHALGASLPDAAAVVNPHRTDCGYPFKSLAGVGVAFKLAQVLLDEGDDPFDFLDVVALGTIADVVPLVGENRVLARFGLERLSRTRRPGLRALMEATGLWGRPVTGGQVAFVLAPRLNAAGRMSSGEQALRLLMAREPDEARAVAESLEDDNDRRREHDERAALDAVARAERELRWPDCASIVLWSEEWHPGVLGIVAARMVERYHRPAVLIALDGDRGRGSGRSVAGVDLRALLEDCGDLLDTFGGHAFAAGLTVSRTRLPELRERFERLVAERVSPESRLPALTHDGTLALAACDLALCDWLERLAPHGLGNPEPVFVTSQARVDGTTVVGDGKHVRLRVSDSGGSAEAIGFGMGGEAATLPAGSPVQLAFHPMRHTWRDETRVQLRLRGIRRT
jgi:single-stranded-DNA-specific exonuclease